MITPVYVDPIFGNDANSGANAANAKATIQAAHDVATNNGDLILLSGTYTDQTIICTLNLTISGQGIVRIVANSNTVFLKIRPVGTGVTRTVTLKNVRLEEWAVPVQSDFVSNVSIANARLECVVASRESQGGSFCKATADTLVGGTLNVVLQNCTVVNYANVFNEDSSFTLNSIWERNSFYDGFSAISGGTGSPTRSNHDYNAYDGNSETNGVNTTGVSRSDIYTDDAAPIPDYSPKLSGSNPLIGTGEYGDHMMAPFWPVFHARTQESANDYFPTDWTGWANDERYYDTGGDVPGVDGPAGASPAVLTGAEPRGWIIDPVRGTGDSCRVLSPVFDAGSNVTFAGTVWWGQEDSSLTSGSKQVIDNSSGTSTRDIEIRASTQAAGSFSATANPGTTTTDWTLFTKITTSSISRRYWQARIVLRNNGV